MEESCPANVKWSKRSMNDVWEKIAHIYDRWVTATRNDMLKRYINKEQEMLDDYLRWLVARNPKKKLTILEIGSGTGRTLLQYAKKPHLIEKIEYLIGIDEASAMNEIAKYKLNQVGATLNHARSGPIVLSKYLFLHLQAEKLLRYFDRGMVQIEKLAMENTEEPIRALDEKKYSASIKVVINMLNTLGVIRETKSLVLRNMVRAAGPDGRIVVSVFNGRAFQKHAKEIYASIKDIVGKFDEDDFDYVENTFATEHYYSHWFTRPEIEGLMKKAGCSNIRTKEIDTIGLFITSEVAK